MNKIIKNFGEFINESRISVDSRLKKGMVIYDVHGDECKVIDWIVFNKDTKNNLEFVKKYERRMNIKEWLINIHNDNGFSLDIKEDDNLLNPSFWKNVIGHLFIAVERRYPVQTLMVLPYITKEDNGDVSGYGVSLDF